MSESRSGVIDLCRPEDLLLGKVPDRGLEPLPGRCVIQMVKPQSRGGVLLPERATHLCDVGRLLAGDIEGASVGDHVVLRPYAGLWLSWDQPLDGRLLGAGDPLWHSVVGTWDGASLRPIGPWLLAAPLEPSLLGLPTRWWKPLKAGGDCPEWLSQVDAFRADDFPDSLNLSPGFGLDDLAVFCTRS
jgi:hypothetical protein